MTTETTALLGRPVRYEATDTTVQEFVTDHLTEFIS
jgi:hypothetical protein